MSEQRRHPRKLTSYRITIFDLGSQEPLGNLVNLSVSGLMLMTDRKLPPGHIFQLQMELPGEEEESHTITFGAESLWNHRISSSDYNWVGFQIIDMSDDDIRHVENITQDWEESKQSGND